MRIQTGLIEFDSKEAAEILGISEGEFILAIERRDFGFYYRTNGGYQFHEGSIEVNREDLAKEKEAKQFTPPGMEESEPNLLAVP